MPLCSDRTFGDGININFEIKREELIKEATPGIRTVKYGINRRSLFCVKHVNDPVMFHTRATTTI